MNLQDALFNWLQIKTVADARPEDRAAKDTMDFFAEILREDHHLIDLEVVKTDEMNIHLQYQMEGNHKKQSFDREATEKLLADIESNPKYNE